MMHERATNRARGREHQGCECSAWNSNTPHTYRTRAYRGFRERTKNRSKAVDAGGSRGCELPVNARARWNTARTRPSGQPEFQIATSRGNAADAPFLRERGPSPALPASTREHRDSNSGNLKADDCKRCFDCRPTTPIPAAAYRARHGQPPVSHPHALTLPITRISVPPPTAALCNAASVRPRFKHATATLPHTRAVREAYTVALDIVQRLALSASCMNHARSHASHDWPVWSVASLEQVGARPRARVMPRSTVRATRKHASLTAHETLPTLYASTLTATLTIQSHVQEPLA